jgi:nicotinamide phosphoribosyltransferase
VTRDSLGFAVKSTYGEIDRKGVEIFKDPVTDTGSVKKSAKGLLKVVREDGKLVLKDRQPAFDADDDLMREVFRDGQLLVQDTLADIRKRIREG